jgi:hypothetical protein
MEPIHFSSTRDHFMRWLSGAYPHLVEGYGNLHAGTQPPHGYCREVETVVDAARVRVLGPGIRGLVRRRLRPGPGA